MKASEVLDKCVQDITSGHWICGELGNYRGANEYMGCAIGLVSINTRDFNGGKIRKFLNYTNEKSPEEAQEAVMALAKMVPDMPEPYDLQEAVDFVVEHNDGAHEGMGLEGDEALDWFKKAADLARSQED